MNKSIILTCIIMGICLSLASYFIVRPNPILCLNSNSLSDEELLETNGVHRGWPIAYDAYNQRPWYCDVGSSGETARYHIDFAQGAMMTSFALNSFVWAYFVLSGYALVKLVKEKR
jgi:hypothetical protein